MFFCKKKSQAEQVAQRVQEAVREHPRTSMVLLGTVITGLALAIGCKYAYQLDLEESY